MATRYTIEQLQKKESADYLNDLQLIRSIIADRKYTCTNYYSPLYVRLTGLFNTVDNLITKGMTELPKRK